MTATRILLAVVPPLMMIAIALALPGIEQWLATFGKTAEAKLTLGRIGLSLPYIASAAIGLIFLLSAQGSVNIKTAGWGGVAGSVAVIALAIVREGIRLSQFAGELPAVRSILSYIDPATMTGATAALFSGIFALRVAVIGNAALSRSEPKRIRGKRALHGEAEWMKLPALSAISGTFDVDVAVLSAGRAAQHGLPLPVIAKAVLAAVAANAAGRLIVAIASRTLLYWLPIATASILAISAGLAVHLMMR